MNARCKCNALNLNKLVCFRALTEYVFLSLSLSFFTNTFHVYRKRLILETVCEPGKSAGEMFRLVARNFRPPSRFTAISLIFRIPRRVRGFPLKGKGLPFNPAGFNPTVRNPVDLGSGIHVKWLKINCNERSSRPFAIIRALACCTHRGEYQLGRINCIRPSCQNFVISLWAREKLLIYTGDRNL